MTGDELNTYILGQQPKFRKYRDNIFRLQTAALLIQHWFFKKEVHAPNIKYVPYFPISDQQQEPQKLTVTPMPRPEIPLSPKHELRYP